MASLRIHFTAEDLARTRIADGPDPLWELVLSATVLRGQETLAPYKPWRRAALSQLAAGPDAASIQAVAVLVPPVGAFPDFLTPSVARLDQGVGLGGALDQVASTPMRQVRADLANVFGDRRPPEWVRDLAAGAGRPMRSLTTALRTYYDRMLVPHRQRISDAVHADRSLRARHFLRGGVEQLLANLPAPITWTQPTLATEYASDRDVYLNGRGITLIPSYFCHRRPITLVNPELPPVLVYPAAADQAAHPAASDALVTLLGRTRARTLAAATTTCSTSELARRLGASVATASRHAAVLHAAGLISSARHGGTVLHTLTRRGATLLAE
jgi:DNA-binding transcriptional ArsR family regulator